jgi:hypothetical protein
VLSILVKISTQVYQLILLHRILVVLVKLQNVALLYYSHVLHLKPLNFFGNLMATKLFCEQFIQ